MIDAYLRWLSARCRPQTVRAYSGTVRRHLDWLGSEGLTPDDMSRRTMSGWLAHLRMRGLSAASVRRELAAVRSYYDYLTIARGRWSRSPVPSTLTMRGPRPALIPMSLTEVERLLEAPDEARPTGLRDRAILETLYASGVRIGEAQGMDLDDVDRLQGRAIVRGKGGHTRWVYLGAPSLHWIHRWQMHDRMRLAGAGETALWLSTTGARLSLRQMARLVPRYSEAAGLRGGFGAHALRHACASHMLEGGADLETIRRILGHATVATTERYLHVARRSARESLLAHHPLAQERAPLVIENSRPRLRWI